jgi:L-aspartate oxidase
MKTDFLVIGYGISGLTYAIKIAEQLPDKKITVVAKGCKNETNTSHAQGGLAIAHKSTRSVYKHIWDTMKAGAGLCNKEVVRMVVNEGPECLEEMIKWGVRFDTNKTGDFDLGKEGGHSVHRVVHYKDVTGSEITQALTERLKQFKNIEFLSGHFVVDLISDQHLKCNSINRVCYGAYVLKESTNELRTIISKITFLGTGGIGQLYKHTTNPIMATGDGIAMAHRIDAEIKDIEFIQFHPTAFYNPKENPSFLITEAIRGFGAKLKTTTGLPFMLKYDSRGELASRDIVARAIYLELFNSDENYVLLDCTHLDKADLVIRFPMITKECEKRGINLHTAGIPVAPAAHYVCGGIAVGHTGETSIRNLFAAGECTRTGMHGGNRLASNSLLEAFVYAKKCVEQGVSIIDKIDNKIDIPDWKSSGTRSQAEFNEIGIARKELRNLMQKYVGIVRSDQGLQIALKKLEPLKEQTENLYNESTITPQLCELRNMLSIACLIVKHSQERRENRGGFYNLDLIDHTA